MEIAGNTIQGGQNIFFAQLANSADIAHFSADATRYFSGEFIFMIFGLPGVALAMYQCAKPERKKAAGGLLLSAALACMRTVRVFLPVCSAGAVCSTGSSCRFCLYAGAYLKHCSRTDILRRIFRSVSVRYITGKSENELAANRSCGNCLFLPVLFYLPFFNK